MTADQRGADRECAVIHVNRGPGKSYFEAVPVTEDDDVMSVAVRVLEQLADELRREREAGPGRAAGQEGGE